MTFPIDQVYLNANVLDGAVTSLEDKAGIVESDDGIPEANSRWPHRRRSWVLSWFLEDTDEVENLFEVNGISAGFLFIATRRDKDYIAAGQLIGTGNGSATQFQLSVISSTYNTGNSPPSIVRSATRDIHYPLSGTVHVYLAGIETFAFTVSTTTGIVTLTSPASNGVAVTASFHFAWPVRFTSEKFDVTMNPNSEEIHSIAVEEVFIVSAA